MLQKDNTTWRLAIQSDQMLLKDNDMWARLAKLNFAIRIGSQFVYILKNKWGPTGKDEKNWEIINHDVMYSLNYFKQGRPGRQFVLYSALEQYLNEQEV